MNILFFKLAFRNILKNKFHSLINVFGFSIGIATTLFIFLFLNFETNFDTFHPDAQRLYRVMTTDQNKDGISSSGFCYYPVVAEMKNEIPGIEDYCRVSAFNRGKFTINQQVQSIEKCRMVDSNFFWFFKFKLITGNPESVLSSAENIVLSKKEAQKLFGNINPLGKSILFNQKHFVVTGIAEELPLNTHLGFDALLSTKFAEQDQENFPLRWDGGMTFLSYLKLSPGISPGKIESVLPSFMYQKINKKIESYGCKTTACLQNIKDVHLSTGENHWDNEDNRSKYSLLVVSSICLLILILAVFNYISIYIAQKASKLKDISLLKIHGAPRYLLLVQTFIEVFILSIISSFIAVVLLISVTPFLNNLLQSSVTIDQNLMISIAFLFIINLVLSILITAFSIFPIFRLKLANVIRKAIDPGGKRNVPSGVLVSFQFTIVILLVVSGLFMARQNNYVLNKELGFNKKNLLSLSSDQAFYNNELFEFKQDLKVLPEISRTCLSSQEIGSGLTQNGYVLEGEKDVSMINVLFVDADFLNCFDVKLNSGRGFYDDLTKEKNSILINRQLVKKTGWKEPLKHKIFRDGALEIIGVVEDFNFAPLQSKLAPLIIMANPNRDGWGYNIVNIKYQSQDVQSLIAKIKNLWQKRFPNIPYEISFLDDKLAMNYTTLVDQQKMIVFFNGLAIFIACIGLFGLANFVTLKRTKEIGIRKINGAKVKEVVVMLNKNFLKWVFIAFVLACPIAYGVMNKWLENFAYKTELSWWVFALAGLFAIGIALMTVSWQSWRAATRNPVEALRYE